MRPATPLRQRKAEAGGAPSDPAAKKAQAKGSEKGASAGDAPSDRAPEEARDVEMRPAAEEEQEPGAEP